MMMKRISMKVFSTVCLSYDSRMNILSFFHLRELCGIYDIEIQIGFEQNVVIVENARIQKKSIYYLYFYFKEDRERKLNIFPCFIPLTLIAKREVFRRISSIPMKKIIPYGCKFVNIDISTIRYFKKFQDKSDPVIDFTGTNILSVEIPSILCLEKTVPTMFQRKREKDFFRTYAVNNFSLNIVLLRNIVNNFRNVSFDNISDLNMKITEDENIEKKISGRSQRSKCMNLSLSFEKVYTDSDSVEVKKFDSNSVSFFQIFENLRKLSIKNIYLRSTTELCDFLRNVRKYLPRIRSLRMIETFLVDLNLLEVHPIEILLDENKTLKCLETDLLNVIFNSEVVIRSCGLEKLFIFENDLYSTEGMNEGLDFVLLGNQILPKCTQLRCLGIISFKRVNTSFEGLGLVLNNISKKISKFVLLAPYTRMEESLFEKIYHHEDHITSLCVDIYNTKDFVYRMLEEKRMRNLEILRVEDHSFADSITSCYSKRIFTPPLTLSKNHYISLNELKNLRFLVISSCSPSLAYFLQFSKSSSSNLRYVFCTKSDRSGPGVRFGFYRNEVFFNKDSDMFIENFNKENPDVYFRSLKLLKNRNLTCTNNDIIGFHSLVDSFDPGEEEKEGKENHEDSNKEINYYELSTERFLLFLSSCSSNNHVNWEEYYKSRMELEKYGVGPYAVKCVYGDTDKMSEMKESFSTIINSTKLSSGKKEVLLNSFYIRNMQRGFVVSILYSIFNDGKSFTVIFDEMKWLSSEGNGISEENIVHESVYISKNHKKEERMLLFRRNFYGRRKTWDYNIISKKGLDFLRMDMSSSWCEKNDVLDINDECSYFTRKVFIKMIYAMIGGYWDKNKIWILRESQRVFGIEFEEVKEEGKEFIDYIFQ